MIVVRLAESRHAIRFLVQQSCTQSAPVFGIPVPRHQARRQIHRGRYMVGIFRRLARRTRVPIVVGQKACRRHQVWVGVAQRQGLLQTMPLCTRCRLLVTIERGVSIIRRIGSAESAESAHHTSCGIPFALPIILLQSSCGILCVGIVVQTFGKRKLGSTHPRPIVPSALLSELCKSALLVQLLCALLCVIQDLTWQLAGVVVIKKKHLPFAARLVCGAQIALHCVGLHTAVVACLVCGDLAVLQDKRIVVVGAIVMRRKSQSDAIIALSL